MGIDKLINNQPILKYLRKQCSKKDTEDKL